MREKDEILQLYRVVVDTVKANEYRRQQINSVFITLMAAGSGVVGAITDFNLIYVAVPAAFVSVIWFLQLRYLRRVAKAKFRVIGELEVKLSYQPFKREWLFIKKSKFSPELTLIEMAVPSIIFLISLIYIIVYA